MKEVQCKKCVMDTSDTFISFDDSGICNYCQSYLSGEFGNKTYFNNTDNFEELQILIDRIKNKKHRGSKYDCLLGLSGGVDSCYVAYLLKKFDLNVLLIHVDTGWNTELAISNIQKTVDFTGFDFFTEVVDWEEIKELQLAYLRSGISNQDVPQDHIIFKKIYDYARKFKIRTFISGGNLATEFVNPKSWHRGSAFDSKSIKYILKKYGSGKRLRHYDLMSLFEFYILVPFVYNIHTLRPLNFIKYDRNEAIKTMELDFGWRNYRYKHGESFFTKFFQNYYLPLRFGFDKRKAHLSSMILSNQISRNEALNELKKELYEEDELRIDIKYICKKLDISKEEFDRCMNLDLKYHDDFPNSTEFIVLLNQIKTYLQKIFGFKIKINS